MSMEEGGLLDDVLQHKVFSVHLHNQWEKSFPNNGWVDRLLLRRYDGKLSSIMGKRQEDLETRSGAAEGEEEERENLTATMTEAEHLRPAPGSPQL
jgi:hypothetical protein